MKRYVDEFRAYATEATRALGWQDLVAVMVFDMNARPALPFTPAAQSSTKDSLVSFAWNHSSAVRRSPVR